jgi:hypothetical protein
MTFWDNLDTWWFALKDRFIEAFFWQWTHNTLLCLMFFIILCMFALHLISHRELKKEAYHRGKQEGYEQGFEDGWEDRGKKEV